MSKQNQKQSPEQQKPQGGQNSKPNQCDPGGKSQNCRRDGQQ